MLWCRPSSKQTRELRCLNVCRTNTSLPDLTRPAMNSSFRTISALASAQPPCRAGKHPDPQDNAPPTSAVPAPENSP